MEGDRPLIFDLWEEVQGFRVNGTAIARAREREIEENALKYDWLKSVVRIVVHT